MRPNAYIAVLVAMALAAAPCLPRALPALSEADTNGDAQVNILDLQRAIAAALDGGGAVSAEADVNRDGRVDVLDVQRILAEATEREEPEPPAAPAGPDAVVPIPVLLLAVHIGQVPFAAPTDDATPSIALPERTDLPRALDRLIKSGRSPHGPPALA